MRTVQIGLLIAIGPALSALQPVYAECEPGWKPGAPLAGIDGVVRALQPWDPDGDGPQPEWLVAAGSFRMAADQAVLNSARWDGERWHAMPGFAGDGTISQLGVSALVVYQGMLVAAWQDPSSNRPTLSRWNGNMWSPFATPTGWSGTIHDLHVHDHELYASGRFTSGGGPKEIARWDGAMWQPVGGNTLTGDVFTMTTYGGELVVSGQIGSGPIHVFRLVGGSWQPVGAAFNSRPRAFAIHVGELIAAGGFSQVGGQPVSRQAARWDGVAWQSMGNGLPEIAGIVRAVVSKGPTLYAALERGGIPSRQLYAWDGIEWTGDDQMPLRQGIGLQTAVLYDQQLVVGGQFSGQGGAVGIATLENGNWRSLPAGGSTRGLLGVTIYDDVLYGYGSFTRLAGQYVEGLAAWRGIGWEVVGGGLDRIAPINAATVNAAFVYGDSLYVRGTFDLAGGQPTAGFARWDGVVWHDVDPAIANATAPTVVSDGYLYFQDVGATRTIRRWDGEHVVTLGDAFNDSISALHIHAGSLFAAGRFTATGTTFVQRIARWDGASWSALGSGVNGPVNDLESFGGALIAAGEFTMAGGDQANRVAAWDGWTWQPLGNGVDGAVRALELYDGHLFAGGAFLNAGGAAANRVAKWNGSEWSSIDTDIREPVGALETYRGDLVIVSGFVSQGFSTEQGFSRWGPRCETGDSDCNGVVSVGDIGAFVLALTDPEAFLSAYPTCDFDNADVDGDGVVSVPDIGPFVEMLTGR